MWYTQNKKKPWTKKGEEITGNTRVEVGLLDPVKCKQIPCKESETSKPNFWLVGYLSPRGREGRIFCLHVDAQISWLLMPRWPYNRILMINLELYIHPLVKLIGEVIRGGGNPKLGINLLRSFVTKSIFGELRDDTKNGCVADYSGNHQQTEWNMNITAQNMKRR